jgi:pyruvate kinase
MDCMRINAAHDHPDVWDRMLRHLNRARQDLGKACRVLVDVAGPKLRTGPVQAVSPVVRWRPDRDRYGRVIRPARVWLTSRDNPRPAPGPAAAILPVAGGWLNELALGHVVKLFDARDSMRELTIVDRTPEGIWAESRQTAYIVPGTMLYLTRTKPQTSAEVGELPPCAASLLLSKGDRLVLIRQAGTGTPATYNERGEVLQPATIGVTLPEALNDVRVGEPIWLDDGAIGGVICAIEPGHVEVTITHARPAGTQLSADKGVNLPDSALTLPALTDKDRDDLRFINGRADLVGYSFVRSAEDVRALQSHLHDVNAGQMGIVLKIETRRALDQLPALLLAAMHSPSSGVMIARGDLAVECGYERLAEVQEEILWMAEASHTPVVWATQVLERLAKHGVPSRAEITDAAMAERAECVMLNKGPYIVEAVRALDDILIRMQSHQYKKSAMLRELALARRFLSIAEPACLAAS